MRAIPILSVAPMMDRTDRHFRHLVRQITRHTLLYTEMVTAVAVVRGNPKKLLEKGPSDSPIALQLGGDSPKLLAEAARIGAEYGYDEINLNIGCPSERVQKGRFGACLMAEPECVAECVAEIRARVPLPVTVKHRIGIQGYETYEHMTHFMDVVAAAGAQRFVVHARIAVLGGLDPHENRTIPPLRYADVYRHKAERPARIVEINGGIRTLAESREHLAKVDGVMIGRAAFDDPYLFAPVDSELFGSSEPRRSREEVAEAMIPYAEQYLREGGRIHAVSKAINGLFAGTPGARAFRRELATRTDEGAHSIRAAIVASRRERSRAA